MRNASLEPERLQQEEADLWAAWKQQAPNVIPDGLPDAAAYCWAPLRILYLLKEVNGGENWDLRQYLRDGARRQTWDVVARWTEAIFSPDTHIPWASLNRDEQDNRQRRERCLPTICAMNLKKIPGTHTANDKELQQAVAQYQPLLKQQLTLYQPDLVVCCGTSWAYPQIMGAQPHWRITSRGVPYWLEPTGTLVITYAHPEARVAEHLLHYGLIDAVRELLG